MLFALAFSIPPSIWTLMSFNLILGTCLRANIKP